MTIQNLEKETIKLRNFFQEENRRKAEGEINNFEESSKLAFNELFINYRQKLFYNLNDPYEHNFYITLKKIYLQKNGADFPDQTKEGKKCADEIFAEYVIEFFDHLNKNYFCLLLKFVILFRECLNNYKTHPGESEFSQANGADTAPDLCNEFITEFMENHQFFGLDDNEVIELIQQFCFWLYENRHTTSRLTLLSEK